MSAGTELAVVLRRLRRSRGMSQRELAKLLFLRAHSAVADYESGRRIPPADIIDAYERVFAVPGQLRALRVETLRVRADREPSPGPTSDGPNQLPLAPTLFTGRDQELALLDKLLGAADERLSEMDGIPVVVVSGMGGVGKTALALHWAHRRAHLFDGGVLYVDLRGFDPSGQPREPTTVLEEFLRAYGLDPGRIPGGMDERAALYRSLLARRRALVVLDNAKEPAQVRPLLPGTATSRVLITSRDRLPGLVTREGAAELPLPVLSVEGAQILLQRLLGRTAPSGEQALAELAGLCGYLPLALRVAVNRIATEADPDAGARQAVSMLADPAARLDGLAVPGDEASAVRRVLSWSYCSFPAPHRRLLRLISLVDATTIDAAAASALARIPEIEARQLLVELAGGHLLEPRRSGYGLHDLVRVFALERVSQKDGPGRRRAAAARYCGYLLHAAAAARQALHPHLPPLRVDAARPKMSVPRFTSAAQALDWYDAQHVNLVPAIAVAARFELHATVWQLATALFGYFDVRKHWGDWEATHRLALDAAGALGDDDALGRIWCNLGGAYWPRYRFAEAVECYERALALFRTVGWRAGQAKALGNMGNLYQETGEWGSAIRHHEMALEIFQEIDDRHGVALTSTNLGYVYTLSGQQREAVEIQRRALGLFESLGDAEGQGRALSNMGKAHARAGRHREALDCHQRGSDLLRAAGNRFDLAYALADQFAAHFALGAVRAALTEGYAALAMFRDIEHEASRALLLAQLATAHEAVGEHDRARALLAEAQSATASVSPQEYEGARRHAPPLN